MSENYATHIIELGLSKWIDIVKRKVQYKKKCSKCEQKEKVKNGFMTGKQRCKCKNFRCS